MQSSNRSGEGGRRACYVTPDLSYDWEGERKKAKIINGMVKKKNTHPSKPLNKPYLRAGIFGQPLSPIVESTIAINHCINDCYNYCTASTIVINHRIQPGYLLSKPVFEGAVFQLVEHYPQPKNQVPLNRSLHRMPSHIL